LRRGRPGCPGRRVGARPRTAGSQPRAGRTRATRCAGGAATRDHRRAAGRDLRGGGRSTSGRWARRSARAPIPRSPPARRARAGHSPGPALRPGRRRGAARRTPRRRPPGRALRTTRIRPGGRRIPAGLRDRFRSPGIPPTPASGRTRQAARSRSRAREPVLPGDGFGRRASSRPASVHGRSCWASLCRGGGWRLGVLAGRRARVGGMRFATIRTQQGTTAARLDGDVLIPLACADVGEMLAAGGSVAERERPLPVSVAEADFAPVVPRPSKVICVGLNYRAHILETGRELPAYPTLFAKFADSLLGPRDELVLPSVSERVDWEVELGVVIGRPVRRASAAEAAAAIAGYTVTNDVSMRDWQRRTLQWLAGKMFQRSTPVGPYLVTPDEVGDAADLEVRCEVDGAVMQQSRTSDLLFGPAQIVSYASQPITLRPGDLILTGTCGGVGDARKPPVYLQPGNLLRTWIEGLGECLNHCVPDKNGEISG